MIEKNSLTIQTDSYILILHELGTGGFFHKRTDWS